MRKNTLFLTIFFILIAFITEAQIKKKNHIIVLIDNSGYMNVPYRGGFSTNQLRSLIQEKLPKILFDDENPLSKGNKLLRKDDYLTLYFCGVNNYTQPTPYNFFTKKLGYEFSTTNRNELSQKLNNDLNFSALFNRDYAGMTMARQLAIYRLGQEKDKPKDVEKTYFLILTDDQLNSKDITTELRNSPFTASMRKRVRKAYEEVEHDYYIPISKSKLVSSVPLENGTQKGWSLLKIKPRVLLADFNVRSLMLDYDSSLDLKRIDEQVYKGHYYAKLNDERTKRYKIKIVKWTLFDTKNNKVLDSGIIEEPEKEFDIDIELKNPVIKNERYQLQLTYDILLNDVYGCSVISPEGKVFDENDNLSMAISVIPEKTAKIFGFYELPAFMFFPIVGDQQSNVVFWNMIFILLFLILMFLILRLVYIHQLTKRTPEMKAKIV